MLLEFPNLVDYSSVYTYIQSVCEEMANIYYYSIVPNTLKSKEIGCHMNWSEEMLRDDFACQKFCLKVTKRNRFCIELWLLMKNGSITTTLKNYITKNYMWNLVNQLQISGKAEYPRHQGNALNLLGSEGRAVL